MANSVLQDRQGPDWPLGFIAVPVPGTPVAIMSVVDPSSANKPETAAGPGPSTSDEYTTRCQQILFSAFKPGAAPPKLVNNTGNIYVVRKFVAPGGGIGDTGIVVQTLTPGQTFVLASAPLNRDVFSPYRYFIDADTANDGAMVTLLVQ